MDTRIKILDTTLRDGEQAPGFSMDLAEKLEMARQLVRLKVDIIEAGFAASSPGDFESVRQVAAQVKDASVCSLCRAVERDIDIARDALKAAVSPRIHVFLATSPIHMKHKLRMTPEQVLDLAAKSVAYAKKFCPDVQFSAEDATRSDRGFLREVIAAVIAAGATTVNLPDTVGYAHPEEMRALVEAMVRNTPGIEKVTVAVHCHNDLGLATANSLAGILGGATQVEGTVGGIGERAGNAALEEVIMALRVRREEFGRDCRLDATQLFHAGRLLQSITGVSLAPNKAVIGQNAFAHEAGIHQHGVMAERTTYEIMTPASVGVPQNQMVLGKHSGRHAFEERLGALGYSLGKPELDAAFEAFKALADKKKTVHDRDLMAIAGRRADELPGRIALESFVIHSGSTIDGTAVLKLRVGEEIVQQVAMGDGPVDAAFKAINAIVGHPFALDSYSLNAVTEGGDALGEAVLRLSLGEKTFTGRGVSTDIIEATVRAYIHAVNKFF